MDDYRDLVTFSFCLVCAGIMLVAGQLYVQHHPIHASEPVEPLAQLQSTPNLVARGQSEHDNTTEPRKGTEKKPTG